LSDLHRNATKQTAYQPLDGYGIEGDRACHLHATKRIAYRLLGVYGLEEVLAPARGVSSYRVCHCNAQALYACRRCPWVETMFDAGHCSAINSIPLPTGATPMSGSSFTLLCQSNAKKKKDPIEEDLEEVYSAIQDLLTNFFEAHLTNEAEAAMWEDIDTCAGTLAELDCEQLKAGQLTFIFHDSWRGGAEAAEHWYRVALSRREKELKGILSLVGLSLKAGELKALLKEDHTKPLVEVQGKIFALEDDGTPILAEGESFDL
jgi:hypothetical protein